MASPIPFIDLKAQQTTIRKAIEERIARVLDHGAYIMGPEVAELEERLSQLTGTKYCISCANGTDALLMLLMALEVKAGDAVFVPTFTFIATAEVVSLMGATPIFVDVDSRTFNMCPRSLELAIANIKKQQPTLRPRGVIAVDLFGLPAEYNEINKISSAHDLFVIEDAAQSFGSKYHDKRAGSLTPYGATSFFPAKPLGCYGDGGAIFCNDSELDAILRSIRVHGQGSHRYEHVRVGLTGRLDTIQAAILIEKLNIFEKECSLRQEIAMRYQDALTEVVTVPHIPAHSHSVWGQYSILTDKRDQVVEKLKEKGIPTMIYYPIPLHLQRAFTALGHVPGDFPVSEKLAGSILSLPMHPYLNIEDQNLIINTLKSALR